jgi:hypothetical protein
MARVRAPAVIEAQVSAKAGAGFNYGAVGVEIDRKRCLAPVGRFNLTFR